VAAGTELVKTTDTTVSATISADQIANLPLVTRNALNFITFLPGVDTTATHGQRDSTIMGLPQSALSISIDGVNVQDVVLKSSDGFFALVRPQTDLVEEVTVSEATPGADASGEGAIQIKFVTRSGSNQHTGSVYEYYRSPWMNTNSPNNYIFNPTAAPLPKNAITLNQYGIREGGPAVVPGVWDGHGKAFYFFNYEEFRLPSTVTRSRTFLNAGDVAGNFNYGCISGTCAHSVNIMSIAQAVAAANPTVAGITTTLDPTMQGYLKFILAAVQTQGTIVDNADHNTSAYSWQPRSLRTEHDPGGRLDWNLTNKEKVTATLIIQKVNASPDILNGVDPVVPGAPNFGEQWNWRDSGSYTLRSTLTKNLVNEATVGFLWDPGAFDDNGVASMWANQGGYQVGLLSVGSTPNSLTVVNGGEIENEWDWNVADNMNWLKGKHSLQFGENFTTIGSFISTNTVVPSLSLGVSATTDPALISTNFFTTANFPGATSGELTSAENLYAMLTGRVTALNGAAQLGANGQYSYLGANSEHLQQRELGLFTQDTWRLKPNFTVNMGVRWEIAFPFTNGDSTFSKNDLADVCGLSGQGSGSTTSYVSPAFGTRTLTSRPYCNFLSPGTLPALASDGGAGLAKIPTYELYSASSPGYATHYNNFSPSLGVAWQPNVQHGFGRAILGDPAQATLRVSYARTFNEDGINAYLPTIGGNPGLRRTENENLNNGNWPADGGAWPVLLSQTSRLTTMPACPAGTVALTCYPTTVLYNLPYGYVGSQGVRAVDPNLQVAYTNSYSFGMSRAIGRDMAMEVRYVGTRNERGLTTEAWNEADIYNNAYGTSASFLDEFKKAQTNLQANLKYTTANPSATTYPNGQKVSANSSFADTGAPGTSPLPIMLAYYQGLSSAVAGDPTQYTSTQFTSSTLIAAMGLWSPNPFTLSSGLIGNSAFTANAAKVGLPANFFVVNPSVANSTTATSLTQAGTLNVLTNGNYTKYDSLQMILTRRLSRGLQFSMNYTYAVGQSSTLDSIYLPRRLSPNTTVVPNSFKATVNYDVPIGRGKRFGANMNKLLDEVVGGWAVNLTGRVQNGAQTNLGNVVLHNMTLQQLQGMIKYYKAADGFWYDLPQSLLLNSNKALTFSSLTTDGYSSTLGPPDPTSQYISRVGGNGCIAVFTGDCGGTINQVIHAPIFSRFDMSVKKTFPFAKRANFQLEIDMLNVFNAIDFNPNFTLTGTFPTSQRVTSAYADVSNTFDPGGRIGQLAFRVNW
jgi:hypothetical protein